MTFAGLPAAQLLPLFGGGAAALTVLYLLRQRRRRLEVPFLRLWSETLRQSEATSLWRKLKRWLSLLLQLLILGLLVLALGDPRLGASQKGRTVVLLLDASASMQASAPAVAAGDRARARAQGADAARTTRFALAKEEARRLVRDLAGDDVAVVVALDSQPAPMGGLSQDERELLAQVDAVTVRDGPADLLRGLRLAQDLCAGRQNPQVVLVSDGGFDEAALQAAGERAAGLDLRFAALPGAGVAAGDSVDANLAITSFSVRRYRKNRLSYEVLVEIGAFPGEPAPFAKDGRDTKDQSARPIAAQLQLLQEGEVVDVQELSIRPGERVQRLYPNLAGSGVHLEARIARKGPQGAARPDLLPLDDRAYALLPERRRQRLLLVTAGNLFLEGALLSASAGDENALELDKVSPAAYDGERAARYDVVLFDSFTPPSPPRTHALYLDPQGAGSPVPIAESVAAPFVTDVAKEHPVLRWVTLKDLNISRASVFRLGAGDTALASMLRKPFVVAHEGLDGGQRRRAVLVGFDLKKSDLPLRVAFPVLLVNALDWLAGDTVEEAQRFATGQTWRIPLGGVGGGKGDKTAKGDRAAPRPEAPRPAAADLVLPLEPGQASPTVVSLPVDPEAAVAQYHGQRVGFYELRRPGERTLLLAANLSDPTESAARWRREFRVGPAPGKTLAPPELGRSALRRVLWPYLLLLALGLLCVEWWSYQRRWTV